MRILSNKRGQYFTGQGRVQTENSNKFGSQDITIGSLQIKKVSNGNQEQTFIYELISVIVVRDYSRYYPYTNNQIDILSVSEKSYELEYIYTFSEDLLPTDLIDISVERYETTKDYFVQNTTKANLLNADSISFKYLKHEGEYISNDDYSKRTISIYRLKEVL